MFLIRRCHHILKPNVVDKASLFSRFQRKNKEGIDCKIKQKISLSTMPCDRPVRALLGIGGNIAPRFEYFCKAMSLLKEDSSKICNVRTSYLYETQPMYVTDQPPFWNAVLEIRTYLDPPSLLLKLKEIERNCGRIHDNRSKEYVENGPRTIDLDILYYGNDNEYVTRPTGDEPPFDLQIPHPRIDEREFVLEPLRDLGIGGKEDSLSKNIERIIPLRNDRSLKLDHTNIMGILNATPDSFSDGGKINSVDDAVSNALEMQDMGADIIDIGGESTRPGAKEVEIKEEMTRVIPIVSKLREVSDVPISVDTRHSVVAREAIIAGADIVNDVSGGFHDKDMLKTVSELNVPYVMMHMRGTPETMQKLTDYDDVVGEISSSLNKLSEAAESAGICKWFHILDPGIGFAKTFEQNLLLLSNIDEIRESLCNAPILTGVSRKGFIGKITGEQNAYDRDYGTAGICAAIAQEGGSNIMRVHNVRGIKHAVAMVDAIRVHNRPKKCKV